MKALTLFSLFFCAFLTMPRITWALDPCDHDRPKVCGGVMPGEGRMHTCLMQHLTDLSPVCQANVKKADDLYNSMGVICSTDINTYCTQFSSNLKQLVSCLRKYHDRLQKDCRKGFDAYDALGYRVRQ